MEIDSKLKDNLIADVENICCINMSDDTKEALKRCFEITVGTENISQKEIWYKKLLVKLHKIKSGELKIKDYISEVENKVNGKGVDLRKERVKIVNDIINEISSRGRKFFSNEGKIAEIVDKNGEVLYKAEYGSKEFISLKKPSPDGWFHGGSLLSLVKEFRDFINSGVAREQSQLHSPYWGYPEEDMKAIRELAIKLGFLL